MTGEEWADTWTDLVQHKATAEQLGEATAYLVGQYMSGVISKELMHVLVGTAEQAYARSVNKT